MTDEVRLDPPVESELIYDGTILRLRVSHYRRPSGMLVRREVIDHVGAVVIVAVEDNHVLMVRQPREAVETYLLELPAGKLDSADEPPLDAAQRELAEEVGRAAGAWTYVGGYFTSPAVLTEVMHFYVATELTVIDTPPSRDDDEEIEIVPVPLSQLPELIAESRDAKTLIGLMHLARTLTP
jgi:8-oxo-dGTP pyrophosphatase MutT (NUDIX family)